MPRPAWFKVILTMILLLTLSLHSSTFAQVNPADSTAEPRVDVELSPMISYQGRLVENGVPANGDRLMSFSIEDTDGYVIWSMLDTTISVSNGLFQVSLGPFNDEVFRQMGRDLWLTMLVAGTELPRQQLMGAPYALSLAPGTYVVGDSSHPIFETANELGPGIVGSSKYNEGVFGSSNSYIGLLGTSLDGIGVKGESTNDYGVYAYGYAANVAALFAGSSSMQGLAISAEVSSSQPTIMMRNNGTGSLLEGFTADSDYTEPEFIIQNDGTVQQELGASGLVKAGALVSCKNTDSEILRQFNNVIGASPITVDDTGVTGTCDINPGFDLSTSYWVVTNPDPTPHFISCSVDLTDTLLCSRFDLTGNVVNGNIMILIY